MYTNSNITICYNLDKKIPMEIWHIKLYKFQTWIVCKFVNKLLCPFCWLINDLFSSINRISASLRIFLSSCMFSYIIWKIQDIWEILNKEQVHQRKSSISPIPVKCIEFRKYGELIQLTVDKTWNTSLKRFCFRQ